MKMFEDHICFISLYVSSMLESEVLAVNHDTQVVVDVVSTLWTLSIPMVQHRRWCSLLCSFNME